MTTVRETTYGLLRRWGMTTVFGNPGSNELPFLDGYPADFRYVLGLHESGVLAMADGYAQVTGRPALVNLHSAAGLGNAMGNLANAANAGTPLVVTAGQQARQMVGLGAMLGEAAMTRVPEPHVKWSFEPTRAEDVPRVISQAVHLSTLPPTGPVFVSLPHDDWDRDVDPDEVARLPQRQVRWAGSADPELVAQLIDRLQGAKSPALVVGAEADTERAQPLVIELAERLQAPVWVAPGCGRGPFPTRHPLFRGILTSSVSGAAKDLEGHDQVLALGTPVFRYHHFAPGPWLAEGSDLIAVGSDPTSAARAPFGDAIVADVEAVLSQLVEGLPAPTQPAIPWSPVERIEVAFPGTAPFSPAEMLSLLGRSLPNDVRMVWEATSVMAGLWSQVDVRQPRSIFTPAAGGLGFGLPAAVGVSLADPQRPVVAVLGDGSTQYGVTGLWTAVQLDLPITFVVVRNGGYEALRGFVERWGVSNAPGLDLPGIDAVQIAAGYGMPATRIRDGDELTAALKDTTISGGPRLLEIPVTARPPQ